MNSFCPGIDSYRSGMNSFQIKLSKVTILPFPFLWQLPLGNSILCLGTFDQLLISCCYKISNCILPQGWTSWPSWRGSTGRWAAAWLGRGGAAAWWLWSPGTGWTPSWPTWRGGCWYLSWPILEQYAMLYNVWSCFGTKAIHYTFYLPRTEL